MSISAADVKALREDTGAGMMDCKKALTDADGDVAEAKKILREKGLAAAGKRADRSAGEGLVVARISDDETVGVLVEVNSETDFVAKGERFAQLGDAIADIAFAAGGTIDGDAKSAVDALVEDARIDLQEKIEFAGAVGFTTETGLVHAYLHSTGGWSDKGVLVELESDALDREKLRALAHDLSLHIQFARPPYLVREEVPEDVLASEREIAAAKARNEGKPEDIIERIADGVVNKYYKQNVLVDQAYVRDDKLNVQKWLDTESGGSARVVRFARFEVGEGAEDAPEDAQGEG